MLPVMSCWRCGTTEGMLFRAYAPGCYYECKKCIAEMEQETDTIAMFSPAFGVRYFKKEEADKILEEQSKPIDEDEEDGFRDDWDYEED